MFLASSRRSASETIGVGLWKTSSECIWTPPTPASSRPCVPTSATWGRSSTRPPRFRYDGQTDVAAITDSAAGLPEVIAVRTVAGDPDALVHFRVTILGHPHGLVDASAATSTSRARHEHVTSTSTLMVLDSFQKGHASSRP